MPKSTLTKRVTPPRTAVESGAPVLDLGGRAVPKGTIVAATTVGGDNVVGTLLAVDHRDGVPFTAAIHTTGNYAQVRHVYVDTVVVA